MEGGLFSSSLIVVLDFVLAYELKRIVVLNELSC